MSITPEFTALTGNPPFNWQKRIHALLRDGVVPSACDIPTGLGKTSIIALWLIALADELRCSTPTRKLPRRLVYIVDRRVVVDQATEEVEKLLAQLNVARFDAQHSLASLARALKTNGLADDAPLIAVSTLRGKKADNQEWLSDPAKPTIIVSTVDMAGSRLCFSPYGRVGRSRRAMHAGLMGQDSLIIIDEAHLCPSFVQTLRSIRSCISQRPAVRPFRVMELSATQLEAGAAFEEVFKLDRSKGDFEDAEVSRRLNSVKRLDIARAIKTEPSAAKPKQVAEAMAERAISLAGKRESVAIFANTVSMVNEIAKLLESKGDLLVLTGEMRGYERDKLMEQQRLKWFTRRKDRADQNHPAFLVATACAEVGINFDADHAVCDVVPLERMIQRFGRVNRFGDGEASIVLIDASAEGEHLPTLAVLNQLPMKNGALDASPASLQTLDRSSEDFKNAWSPAPPFPVLDEARIDDWSMTSFDAGAFDDSTAGFPKPQVSYWLRGLVSDDSINVNFVWRNELDQCANAADAVLMAQAIPASPREIASINAIRVAELLKGVAKATSKGWLVYCDESEEWQARWLSDMAKDERFIDQIRGGTVFLPCDAGGLKDGVPAPTCTDRVTDRVNDEVEDRLWLRARLKQREGVSYIIDDQGDGKNGEPLAEKRLHTLGEDESIAEAVADIEAFADYTLEETSGCDDPPSDRDRILYLRRINSSSDGIAKTVVRRDVTVDGHNLDVERQAKRLCDTLGIEPHLAEAVVFAARWHDEGKKNQGWQAMIGCTKEPCLAKSKSSFSDYSKTQGYRHEFGSLVRQLAKDSQTADLVLHLIASHHGWARPYFKSDAHDPDCSDSPAIAAEAALRFARLQQSLGWWQLAYLESLVKAADALASKNPT